VELGKAVNAKQAPQSVELAFTELRDALG